MAKVTHPLHSLAAHGSIANALVFRTGKAGSTARQSPTHSPPRSTFTIQQGEKMQIARDRWRDLPAPIKAQWATSATINEMPTFARYYQQRVRQNTPDLEQPLLPT